MKTAGSADIRPFPGFSPRGSFDAGRFVRPRSQPSDDAVSLTPYNVSSNKKTMSATFASRRILLVEDDQELRYAYATHLTANGFLVEEASDLSSRRRALALHGPTSRCSTFACQTAPPLICSRNSRNSNLPFRSLF